jgi:hypothetical protein
VITRSIGFHSAILALAGLVAVRALTHTDAPLAAGAAEIWSGKPDQIERLEFENDRRHVVIEFKSDERGRYAVGTVERTTDPAPNKAEAGDGDAGAAPPPPALATRETLRFVGVKDLNEFVAKLAPLRATRDLGAVATDRAKEYGLDGATLPKLTVQIAGASHQLWFGGTAPGGGDVYAYTGDRQRALALPGNLLHDLEAAETKLIERNLHEFDVADATRVAIRVGAASRELTRSTESAAFWTDPGDPAGKDETASNWMKNFERLRVNEYVEPGPSVEPLFRAEYFGKQGKTLGFVEFARVTQDGKAKPDYLVRSEQTRWWGKVLSSSAEPVAQDLPSIVK